jgi:hypothetical protein
VAKNGRVTKPCHLAQEPKKTGSDGAETAKILEFSRKLSQFPEFLWMFPA